MYIFFVILLLLPHELLDFSSWSWSFAAKSKQSFAPNLGQRAAHLGGNVLWLLDKIYSSSSGGWSFSFFSFLFLFYFIFFKLQMCSLVSNANEGKWRFKKENNLLVFGAHLLYNMEGAEQFLIWLFWVIFILVCLRFGTRVLSPRGTTSQVSSRPLWHFSLSREPSFPASYQGHIPGNVLFISCRNAELLFCQSRGNWRMLPGVAMLHILDF